MAKSRVIQNADPQALRVYDAEDSGTRDPRGLDRRSFRCIVNDVCHDPRWIRKWGRQKPRFLWRSRSATFSFATERNGKPVIALSQSNIDRGMHMILHEMAHLMCPLGAGHSPRFCRTLLYLYERYAGTVYAKALRKRYRQTGALR